MAYSLKSVWYKEQYRKILLQNENGPCPLLAAANALLLSAKIRLPEASVRNNIASIDDVVNMLAGHALKRNTERTTTTTTESGDSSAAAAAIGEAEATAHHIDELLKLFPSLQHGMDVNPKFTLGPTGCEYTNGLGAFDIMGVELVHGWLIDVIQEPEVARVIGSKSYNELVEIVIKGNEAMEKAQELTEKISTFLSEENDVDADGGDSPEEKQEGQEEKGDDANGNDQTQLDRQQKLDKMQNELQNWNEVAYHGTIVKDFLDTTSHQLSYTGLTELHSYVQEGSLCVFFRNNHFATLTKYEGTLYLLVTDLGYAGVKEVVWEKLDDISGDTDLFDGHFCKSQIENIQPNGSSLSPEQQLALRGQSEQDYQIALELSRNQEQPTPGTLAEREGDDIARATELSLQAYNNQGQGTVVNVPGGTTAGIHTNVESQQFNNESNNSSLYEMQMRFNEEERDREMALRLQAELNAADARTVQSQQRAVTSSTMNRQHTVEERGRRHEGRDAASSGCYIC